MKGSFSSLVLPCLVSVGVIVGILAMKHSSDKGETVYDKARSITYGLWSDGKMKLENLSGLQAPLHKLRNAILAAPAFEDKLNRQLGEFVQEEVESPERELIGQILGEMGTVDTELLTDTRKHLVVLVVDGMIDGIAQAELDDQYSPGSENGQGISPP